MLKKIVSSALVLGMLMLPMGCAKNYKVHSDNVAKRELYLNNSKKESMRLSMIALQKIIESFEEQAYDERINEILNSYDVEKPESGEKGTIFKYTAYTTSGKVSGVYEISDFTDSFVKMNDSFIRLMIRQDISRMKSDLARIKKEVVREFVPIFQAITEQMVNAGNPPKTWMDIASEFVKHVPMLATMGAFYKLADAAIANAGNVINANLQDNAKLNVVKGNGNSTDGSTIAPTENDIQGDASYQNGIQSEESEEELVEEEAVETVETETETL